jgi:transcriptional regulator with XRE-family HTH domain
MTADVLPPADLFAREQEAPTAAMPGPERQVRTLAAASGFANLAELARAAHVTRTTVAWAVRGERTPRRKVIARLSTTLGVAPAILDAIFAKARAARGVRP